MFIQYPCISITLRSIVTTLNINNLIFIAWLWVLGVERGREVSVLEAKRLLLVRTGVCIPVKVMIFYEMSNEGI